MRSSSDTRRITDEPHAPRLLSVAAAVIGAAVVGTAGTAIASHDAAHTAADVQKDAANAQITQQNKQFDQVQKLLAPYQQAGTGALSAQQDLTGLNGNDAQSKAISALQASPQYQALLQSGNSNILANASATGGLRGGNTQAALAQFSPALLAQTINNQYSRLGGLTSIGQNAAAGVGNAGMATGNNITGILGQQGQIGAGAALASGQQIGGAISGLTGAIGAYGGYGGFNNFGSYTRPNIFGQYSNPAVSGGGGYGIGGDIGTAQLGGAGTAGDFSDARLKTNVRRIGKTARGNDLHTWEWKDGSGKGSGVIAQKVAGTPGAVAVDPRSGFLRVNYRKV